MMMGSFALTCNRFHGEQVSARLSDYEFELPTELIADRPLPRREDSRMMVLRRSDQSIEHTRFAEIARFSEAGDLFVLNDTRVVLARKFSDDEQIEFLFLERLSAGQWRCLVKPGRKMKVGARTSVDGTAAVVMEILDSGERVIQLEADIDVYSRGILPLPPYIRRPSDAEDTVRYQTVYAQKPGAVAAPTAGLHFTPEILSQLPHTFVTLHVGLGTFQPVQTEDLTEHRMHSERFEISPEAAAKINDARRIVAIGTTSVRVLESARRENGQLVEQSGTTDIFIYPPFTFRFVDALLTNFHLPRSTLIMLVSAFAGREFIRRAYDEAIREKYRFFSYGDCMLIL
jgi:S-adenosylmethionine:tRNA ribosyltransferase-isomerase